MSARQHQQYVRDAIKKHVDPNLDKLKQGLFEERFWTTNLNQQTESLRDGGLNSRSLAGGKLVANTVTRSETSNNLDNGDNSTPTFRTLDNSGHGAASFNHTHSVSFKQISRERRRELLALEDEIRSYDATKEHVSREEFEALKKMVLSLFELAADDPDLDRYERERMLDDPERQEEARAYKNHHLVDDWEYERRMPAEERERIERVSNFAAILSSGEMKPASSEREERLAKVRAFTAQVGPAPKRDPNPDRPVGETPPVAT